MFACVALADLNPPKPGFNLFSPQQDIQLGREAAAQIERQMPVVRNQEIQSYMETLGKKLARSSRAGNFPYSFRVVANPAVNAFSLPGGPVYVNSGLFPMAANEAQLAGVLAHEISHIALRHGTHQATKSNLVRIPAILASVLAGNSMLGQLAQIGVGVGANSVLLRFSRSDESEADYLGAIMMSEAGYNPIEMARFFERLEAQSGRKGGLSQFLSDHPNPGNRVRAVEEEIRQMPRRDYTSSDTGQFARIKGLVMDQPGPRQLRGSYMTQQSQAPPAMRPSSQFRQYSGNAVSLSYPDNWQVFADQNSPTVTIAPRDALLEGTKGVQVGYGLIASYFMPDASRAELRRDTEALIGQLQRQNTKMRFINQRSVSVERQTALLTTLNSRSPYAGETEVEALVTLARPEGLFYLLFIAPQSEWNATERIFENILATVRFR